MTMPNKREQAQAASYTRAIMRGAAGIAYRAMRMLPNIPKLDPWMLKRTRDEYSDLREEIDEARKLYIRSMNEGYSAAQHKAFWDVTGQARTALTLCIKAFDERKDEFGRQAPVRNLTAARAMQFSASAHA